MAPDSATLSSKPSRYVRHTLRIVRALHKGANLAPAPWYEFRLTRGDFRELRNRLNMDKALEEFVEEKVRWDYAAADEILVFRRPNPFQNSLIVKLVAVIENLLCIKAMANDPMGAFARLLRADVAPAIYLDGSPVDYDGPDFLRRHPDAAFRHADARFPGVIIEVTNRDTFLGKRGLMWFLAREYILRSHGDVRVVISVEIDSRSSLASISMWRPRMVRALNGTTMLSHAQVMDCVPFRDEYGQSSIFPGADLMLNMRDFAEECLTADLPSEWIVIRAITLTRILNNAEEEEFKRVAALEERLSYPRHLAPWSRATLALGRPPGHQAAADGVEDGPSGHDTGEGSTRTSEAAEAADLPPPLPT